MKFAHSKSKINHNHTKKSNGLRVADKKSQPPKHEVIRAAEVKNCFEPRIARIYTDKKSEKNHGVGSLSECWIFCGKDTRKRACRCFFTTHPCLETKRNPGVFSQGSLSEAQA